MRKSSSAAICMGGGAAVAVSAQGWTQGGAGRGGVHVCVLSTERTCHRCEWNS